MSREAWLWLHVLGAILFLGNIVVTALWKVLADRTRSPAVVAFAQRLVTTTDVAFTAPGIVLIVVSGQVLAGELGGVFGGPTWLTMGWSLFVASGAVWLLVLVPIQAVQHGMARRFASEDVVPERYWRLSALWAVVGAVATVLPLATLYLMVLKPDL
jgi:uncharacterized membrane protein